MKWSALVAVLAAEAAQAAVAATCSPLEVVVARGTYEPGTYGLIVGDPFVRAVQGKVRGATGFNIDYPANADSSSSDTGARMVVEHLTSQSQACPQQKFVVTGYSQGASVLRKAMANVPAAALQKVIGIVTFGDPGWNDATKTHKNSGSRGATGFGNYQPLPNILLDRFFTNCASGDPTCGGGMNILAHLTYSTGNYMANSANFVQQQFAKLGG